MKATIIGQNHKVTTYEVNGRKRYIIEDIPLTQYRRKINAVVKVVGRKWEDVVNYLDSDGYTCAGAFEKTIDSMTY